MNLRALVVVVSSLVALNTYACLALAAAKTASDAEKATSEEVKPTEVAKATNEAAKEASSAEAKASAAEAKVGADVHKAESSVENAAKEAENVVKEKTSAEVYKTESAAEKAATDAEDATKAKVAAEEHKAESAVDKAEDATKAKVATEEHKAESSVDKVEAAAENAAKAAGDTVTDWFDTVTGKVKGWLSKTPETAQKYSDEVKKQYLHAKESVQSNVKQGMAKGKEATETVTQWFDKTFSKQRIDEAKQWLVDFKNGTEETVIDPLVPYLLAIRYPHPIEEWNAGYRRVFNVQLKGYDKPVDIQLPMSWAITETLNVDGNKIIAWRSDSGDGQLMTAIIHTPNGASVESIMAGLEKNYPDAKVVSVGNEGIKRITCFAKDDSHNAYYYYAIPLAGKTLELCTGVIRNGGEGYEELNKRLEERADFFNLVAENVFTKSTPEPTPTE